MIERIEETLRQMLSDPSEAVRGAAAAALDTVRLRRQAAALQAKLRAGSVEEKVRVVYSAGEIGGGEGLSVILAALSDPAEEVRGAAARTLEGFLVPKVLQAMVAMLPREKGIVLCNLIESLGKSRRKELAPIMEKYMEHPDAEVRGRAILGYARTSPDGWEKILSRAGSPDEPVRAAVARSLGEWSAG